MEYSAVQEIVIQVLQGLSNLGWFGDFLTVVMFYLGPIVTAISALFAAAKAVAKIIPGDKDDKAVEKVEGIWKKYILPFLQSFSTIKLPEKKKE